MRSRSQNWAVGVGILGSLWMGSAWSMAEDWSRFRGPNGRGKLSAEADLQLPQTWSNEQGVLWKTQVPKGASSPVVSGSTIFLTGFSGYGEDLANPGQREALRLHILAVDAETGQLRWNRDVPAAAAEQEATPRIADHGYASPTPCTDGQAVYASFGPSGVVAMNFDGELLWRADVGHQTAGFGAAASPLEWEKWVIINASIESGRLIALDKQTGQVAWQVEGIDRAWTTPALVHLPNATTELVIHSKDEIQGLDPRNGEQLWRCQGIPDYIVPGPVVEGDTVYFSGGRQNKTIAVRAGGRGDVSQTHKLWEVTSGANVTSPLLHDGHLFWAHDKAWAQCISAADGHEVYQQRFRDRERVYASVIYGDQKLFMTLRDGTTLVLAAEPTYQELAVNKLGADGEQFNATPAIYRNSLLLRSTDYLYRIGEVKP